MVQIECTLHNPNHFSLIQYELLTHFKQYPQFSDFVALWRNFLDRSSSSFFKMWPLSVSVNMFQFNLDSEMEKEFGIKPCIKRLVETVNQRCYSGPLLHCKADLYAIIQWIINKNKTPFTPFMCTINTKQWIMVDGREMIHEFWWILQIKNKNQKSVSSIPTIQLMKHSGGGGVMLLICLLSVGKRSGEKSGYSGISSTEMVSVVVWFKNLTWNLFGFHRQSTPFLVPNWCTNSLLGQSWCFLRTALSLGWNTQPLCS